MRINGESLKSVGELLLNKKSLEVTAENVGELRGKVGAWRETRGLDLLAAQLIPDLAEKALAADLPHDAASFWSELSLIGSQYIDAAALFERIPGIAIARTMGLNFLEKSVIGTRKILENTEFRYDPRLEINIRRQGRFEGLLEFHKGHFAEAVTWYDHSIFLFNQAENVDMRANVLELKAFKAEANIWQGEVGKGVEEGLANYNDFEQTPEGQHLKEKKLQQWENWRAGNVTKLVTALLGTDSFDALSVDSQKPHLLAMFKEVYGYKQLFPKRKQQLAKLWEKLQQLHMVTEELI